MAICLATKDLLRAVSGTRTRDPQLGKLMLYQLSYYRITFISGAKTNEITSNIYFLIKICNIRNYPQ